MNRNRLWRDAPSVHLHPAVIIGCPPGTGRQTTPQDATVTSHASLHEPGHQPAGDEVMKELGGDPLITALRTLYTLLGAPDQLIDPANSLPASHQPVSKAQAGTGRAAQ